MAIDWNLAQVLVGIFAVLAASSIIGAIRHVFHASRKLISPSKFQCERLEWRDVPEGLLHECSMPKTNCQHLSLLQFYQWMKRGTLVPKPDVLDPNTTYVQTDQNTLEIFLALNWNKLPFLVFEEVGPVTTAYLKPTKKPDTCRVGWANWDRKFRTEITKSEAAQLLRGYPPWYSEQLLLRNGDKTKHPLQTDADLTRGGWVVALGLSNTTPAAREFMFRGVNSKNEPNRCRPWVTATRALGRLVECLGSATKAFPEEPAWMHGQDWVKHILDNSTGWWSMSTVFSQYMKSPIYHLPFMKDNGKQDERWIQGSTDFAAQLSTYQCQMAMQAFSHPGDFSEEEIAAIWPAQLLILRAVLMGCYEVFDYLEAVSKDSEDENNEMTRELRSKKGPIFLRQWKEGDRERA